MNHLKLALPLFLSLALAGDISLQAFSSPDCGGTSLTNVHANAANPKSSSNCVAAGQYNSVSIISADPGFKCNVFSDNACNNFLQSFDSPGCQNVIGTGVICFSQALFDNPFAESKAVVTLGHSNIVALTGGDTTSFVKNAISSACDATGCDPNTKATSSFQRNTDCNSNLVQGFSNLCNTQEKCSQSVTATGNYDNTDQRDYMSALLQTAMQQGTGAAVDNPSQASLVTILSFAQVVINDQNGNNQAEMSVSVDVSCSNVSPTGADCDGLLASITSKLLEAVPEVGEVLAPAFEITCQALSG